MIKIKNLGMRVTKDGSKRSYALYLCPICNKEVEKRLGDGERCKSCGCDKGRLISKIIFKHGEGKTKLYRVWSNIKNRCFNPKTKQFKDYGGRGIIVCPEWTNDYTKFRDWALNNCYQEGLEIDRINNNGDYEPFNCRFVTGAKNCQNKRNNKLTLEIANEIRVKYNTGNYTQRELAKKYKTGRSTIYFIISNKIWKNTLQI